MVDQERLFGTALVPAEVVSVALLVTGAAEDEVVVEPAGQRDIVEIPLAWNISCGKFQR